MRRRTIVSTLIVSLCLVAPWAYAQRGRGEGRSSAGRSPGGEWSQRSHQGTSHGEANRGRGEERNTLGANNNQRNEGARGGVGGQGGNAGRNEGLQRGAGQQGFGKANANGQNTRNRQPGEAAAGASASQRRGTSNPAGGTAAANSPTNITGGTRNTAVGGTNVAANANGANAVRGAYNNPHLYNNDWYAGHAGVWYPHGWTAAGVWAAPTWGAVGGYYGASSVPISYNYGVNPAYANGMVTMNGQPVGTPAEFSQQAAALADSGANAEVTNSGDDWMSLGVFAMVRNEQQEPQLILQLAINKQGVLRGNYTDEVTDHTQPIQGAADPKTQRAAWTVGDNKSSVMEAGLSDLAQGEAPALIHKNGKTDHWLLVRLDKPHDENSK